MSKRSKKSASGVKIPKTLLAVVSLLSRISPRLLTLVLARLFTTPIRHKIPKRELQMDQNSIQTKLFIPEINKNIVVYKTGTGEKQLLLVHGWSGRGTQLFKFADAFTSRGWTVISFDAPAHGKAEGKTTLMPEFIASIMEIEKTFGTFDAAIGHSLGGMSLLNAARRGFKPAAMVVIGSGDIVEDIILDFVGKMKLKKRHANMLRHHFEQKSGQTMNSFSSYLSAKDIQLPVLVIHDESDAEVPVSCAIHIHKHLKNGTLLLTKGLGHRKILGDKKVIEASVKFILHENTHIHFDDPVHANGMPEPDKKISG